MIKAVELFWSNSRIIFFKSWSHADKRLSQKFRMDLILRIRQYDKIYEDKFSRIDIRKN